VTVHRKELDDLRADLTRVLLGQLPEILRPYLNLLLQPLLAKLQDGLNKLLDTAPAPGTAALYFYQPTPPTPSPSTVPSASGTCAVTLPAGTYTGTFTGDDTTIEPPGQIDLGESGGENGHTTGELTVTVAPDGTVGGNFQWTMVDHMVFHGPAQGTIDKTIQVQGAGVSGTLCNLMLTFASETETACTATGEPVELGVCRSIGKTIPMAGLVPPQPLGAPTSVAGGTMSWSHSSENGVDLGFGGLSVEVQSTFTVTLRGP